MMDRKFEEILATLPDKPVRSRLEPYGELIVELRRRGRTFREIAAILEEQCQLRVAASTVVRFLIGRSRRKRESRSVKRPTSVQTVATATSQTVGNAPMLNDPSGD